MDNIPVKESSTEATQALEDYFGMQDGDAAEKEEKAAELLQKKDKESGARKYTGWIGIFIAVLAIGFALFHLWCLGIKPIEALNAR